MRKLLILMGIAFIGTSCSKFQYASLNSDLKKDRFQKFIFENDTLKINYSYTGQNGPFTIEVYNKHPKPIYVDWKRSSFILNGIRYPYWSDESTLQATNSEFSIQWTRSIATSNGEINGSIRKEEQISFIPPQSMISVTPIYLKSNPFSLPQAKANQKESVHIEGAPYRFTRYSFVRENAPLKFRSFMAYSDEVEFRAAHYLDHEFWIGEVIATGVSPDQMKQVRQDQFHIQELTDYGQFMGTLLGLGALALLVGAAASQ